MQPNRIFHLCRGKHHSVLCEKRTTHLWRCTYPGVCMATHSSMIGLFFHVIDVDFQVHSEIPSVTVSHEDRSWWKSSACTLCPIQVMAFGGLKLLLLSSHAVAQGLVSARLSSRAPAPPTALDLALPMGWIQACRHIQLVENTKHKGLRGTETT